MKKFFAVLGIIFLIVILLGAMGIAFVAVRGNALDKESKAYADTTIPAIITSWNEKELLDRASPEFNQSVTRQELDRMFQWFKSLGSLKKCEPAHGQAVMAATTQTGKRIEAEYTAKANFEKGEAMIRVALIKHDNRWQILGFFINSAAFLPRQESQPSVSPNRSPAKKSRK